MADSFAANSAISAEVVRSSLANYLAQFITLGTGFLLTPFVLYQLGPTHYGLWALVGSLVAYGSLLDFGIASAVTKYVAEYRARGQIDQVQSLIATALWLYVGLGLVAVILGVIGAFFLPNLLDIAPDEQATAMWLVLLSGISIGISIPCAMPWAVLRGLQRFDLISVIQITGTLVVTVATVIVLLLGKGVLGMVALNIPLTLIMQVPSIWLVNRSAPELHFGWSGAKRSLIRRVFAFSSSMFVIQVASRLDTKTDEFVIGTFLPVAAITPFAIARRLSEMAQILTDQFMKVLLPLASKLHAENDGVRLRAMYIVSTRLTIAIFLPIACVLVILARYILLAWVGPLYADYAYLVIILTISSLIATSLWPAGTILQGIARHHWLAFLVFSSGVANLVLSILLVRPFGLAGVALGTLIPVAISRGILLPYVMRIFGLSVREISRQILLPTLLPAIPTVAILCVLGQILEPATWAALIAVAGIGWLVYMTGYLHIGSSKFEREIYLRFARRTIDFAQLHLKRP